MAASKNKKPTTTTAGTKSRRGKKSSALDEIPAVSPTGTDTEAGATATLAEPDEPAAAATASVDGPAVWVSEQESFMLERLVLQLPAKSGGGWRDPIWQLVAREVNEKFPDAEGGRKTATKCRDKFTKLKGQYSGISKMRGLSGFGWCNVRCVPTASDAVWDGYLKAHPKQEKWRNTPFPLYDTIALLSGDSIANGLGVVRIGTAATATNTTTEVSSSEGSEDEQDEGLGSARAGPSQVGTPAPKRKASKDDASPHPHKKHQKDNRRSSAGGLFAMASSIRELGASMMPNSGLQPSPVRIKNAIEMVEENEGLDDDEMLAVVKLFSAPDGSRKADAYTAIPRKAVRTAYLKDILS